MVCMSTSCPGQLLDVILGGMDNEFKAVAKVLQLSQPTKASVVVDDDDEEEEEEEEEEEDDDGVDADDADENTAEDSVVNKDDDNKDGDDASGAAVSDDAITQKPSKKPVKPSKTKNKSATASSIVRAVCTGKVRSTVTCTCCGTVSELSLIHI